MSDGLLFYYMIFDLTKFTGLNTGRDLVQFNDFYFLDTIDYTKTSVFKNYETTIGFFNTGIYNSGCHFLWDILDLFFPSVNTF